ncbi:MAG TPA: nitroreductase/quinone reductase family protein [Thermomicrobiales bacterium]|nr:nitroreductase/quinone reductase family protein [Thermomicrobiales bacterium]
MNAPFDLTTPLGYLETIGRVSGRRRETEIWFAWEDGTIYLLSGGGLAKDWIRNFRKTPEVRFRVGAVWVSGTARIVEDPELDRRIRRVVAGKYYGFDPDSDAPLPNAWSRTAVPVAVTINPGP